MQVNLFLELPMCSVTHVLRSHEYRHDDHSDYHAEKRRCMASTLCCNRRPCADKVADTGRSSNT